MPRRSSGVPSRQSRRFDGCDPVSARGDVHAHQVGTLTESRSDGIELWEVDGGGVLVYVIGTSGQSREGRARFGTLIGTLASSIPLFVQGPPRSENPRLWRGVSFGGPYWT